MLGLFSDLIEFTVVNESLSINNLMFCKGNNSTVSKYYQQNMKSTQKMCVYIYPNNTEYNSNTNSDNVTICDKDPYV